MEQLTGLDATFLYLETPSLHMHVSMAAIFDPSTVPGGYSYEKLRKLVSSRLALAPIFRRRLVEVPFRLGHPYWVDDPSFDIDYHMRRGALPAPGGIEELAQFVGDVCSRQLDRTKPLWEMYIVEGLRGGNIAVVTKIHHSTIDGVSGAELLGQLFDLEPTAAESRDDGTALEPQAAGDRLPSDLHLAGARPRGPPRPSGRDHPAGVEDRPGRARCQAVALPEHGHAALPLTTPRTSLNAAITPHRRVAFSSISLDDVKRVKRAFGTTVNDVVLAVCTGGAAPLSHRRRRAARTRRSWPRCRCRSPPRSETGGANKVSAMFVALPCQIDDPVTRPAHHPRRHQGRQGGAPGARGGRPARLGRARHPQRVLGGGPGLHPPEAGRAPPAHPQPDHLQRAGTRLPPLPRRGGDGGGLPPGPGHGRGRAQHHGDELPRRPQLGPDGVRRDRARGRRCWPPPSPPLSTSCSRRRASNRPCPWGWPPAVPGVARRGPPRRGPLCPRAEDGAGGEGDRPVGVGLVGCGMIGQIHADGCACCARTGPPWPWRRPIPRRRPARPRPATAPSGT